MSQVTIPDLTNQPNLIADALFEISQTDNSFNATLADIISFGDLWTGNQDADGFNITDLGSVDFISDALFNVLGTSYQFSIGGSLSYEMNSTELDLKGNNLVLGTDAFAEFTSRATNPDGASGTVGFLYAKTVSEVLPFWQNDTTVFDLTATGGDVFGPGATTTENEIVRWDNAFGTLIKNSGVFLDDAKNFTGIKSLQFQGSASLPTGDIIYLQAGSSSELRLNLPTAGELQITFDSTNSTGLTFNEEKLFLFDIPIFMATGFIDFEQRSPPTLVSPDSGRLFLNDAEDPPVPSWINENDEVFSLLEGDVSGPGSSTDMALVRWVETDGDEIQDSVVILDGNGDITGVNEFTLTSTINFPSGVTQTFMPDATEAGLNVGSVDGEPSNPLGGDLIYDTAVNVMKAFIDGAWMELGPSDQTPWASDINGADNFLFNVALVKFNLATSQSPGNGEAAIYANSTGMRINIPTDDKLFIDIANNEEYSFELTQADFSGHDIILGTAFIEFTQLMSGPGPGDNDTGKLYAFDSGGVSRPFWVDDIGATFDLTEGTGDVSGPGMTTNEDEIALWTDGTGTAIKNSAITIDSLQNVESIRSLQFTGDSTFPPPTEVYIQAGDTSSLIFHVPSAMIFNFEDNETSIVQMSDMLGIKTFGRALRLDMGFVEFQNDATPPPDTPDPGFGRLFAEVVSTVSHLFWIDEAGTETDLVAGASSGQTPWTQEINAAGNNLINLSNLIFQDTALAPGATDRSIFYNDATGMEFNALDGDELFFKIDGNEKLRIEEFTVFVSTANIDMQSAGLLDVSLITQEGFAASVGFLQLQNASLIAWRNVANDGDFTLAVSSNDQLVLDGTSMRIQSTALQDYNIFRDGVLPIQSRIGGLVCRADDFDTVEQIYGSLNCFMESSAADAEQGGWEFSVAENGDFSIDYIHLNQGGNNLIEFFRPLEILNQLGVTIKADSQPLIVFSDTLAAASSNIGRIRFDGLNDAAEELVYADIVGRSQVITDGAEKGQLLFRAFIDTTLVSMLRVAGEDSAVKVENADLWIDAGKKFFLDEGADNSIREDSNNVIIMEVAAADAIQFTNNLTAEPTIKLLDGGSDYSIGRLSTGGFLNFIGEETTFSGFNFETNLARQLTIENDGDVILRATNELFLDGVDGTGKLNGGNTSIRESTVDRLTLKAGGVDAITATTGGAQMGDSLQLLFINGTDHIRGQNTALSPGTNTNLLELVAFGNNTVTTDESIEYSRILFRIGSNADGSEGGKILFSTADSANSGALTTAFEIQGQSSRVAYTYEIFMQDIINMNNNNVDNVGALISNGSSTIPPGVTLIQAANLDRISWDNDGATFQIYQRVTNLDELEFVFDGIVEYTFGASSLDMEGNDLIDANFISGVGLSILDPTLNANVVMELGNSNVASTGGVTAIDFRVGDTDNDTRLIRNGGVNGTFDINQQGTGAIQLEYDGSAEYVFTQSAATFNQDLVMADARLGENKGANVASSGTMTLGGDGNTFLITGTTAIDFITTTGWQNGAKIILIFASTADLNDNTATPPANTLPLLLEGGGDFTNIVADDNVCFVLDTDAGFWREISRTEV